MAVLALYLFGGEVLKGFAFTMLVGTIATTYSGWFIAPSLAIAAQQEDAGRADRATATAAEPAAVASAAARANRNRTARRGRKPFNRPA